MSMLTVSVVQGRATGGIFFALLKSFSKLFLYIIILVFSHKTKIARNSVEKMCLK
jgi:hypothetical protein